MKLKSARGAPQVSAARWAFALSVIFGFSAAMVLVARTTGPAAAALAGILFTVPLCSLGEWLVHGVLYHGKLPGLEWIHKIHHAGHHFALFPPDRYVQDGPYEFMRVRAPLTPFEMSSTPADNTISKWGQVALHFVVGVPLILVPAYLASQNLYFVTSAAITLGLISWLLAYVHGVIHTPRSRLIEHMAWFQWLDRHHYVHHVDMHANINFLLPICDLLLGTEKRALTPEEIAVHGPFELAKPMAKDVLAELARAHGFARPVRPHRWPSIPRPAPSERA
jgi:hypothetical protein